MLDSKKKRIVFFALLFMSAVASFFYFFEGKMNAQNTTAYALNYKYGIIPRGFIGSVINVFNKILPFELYNYRAFMIISFIATCLFFLLLFVFYYIILKKTQEKDQKLEMKLIEFLSVFIFPEFWSWNNYGRLDEYLTILTIICLILIVVSKCEWLIPIICVIACFIHVGFVFTNVAIILVMLFYKGIIGDARKKKYYYSLLIITFVCVSIAFLYLEMFIEHKSIEVYNEIVALAKSCSFDGNSISDSLLDSEILGKNVYTDEWVWRKRNIVEFPLFVLFFSPYLVMGIRFIKRLICQAKSKKDKIIYTVMCFGIITILPSLILKVDYGRWMFCIVFYYVAMTIILIALQDEYFTSQFRYYVAKLNDFISFYPIIILYPLLFMPFRDVYISDITTRIMDAIAHTMNWW